MGSSTMPSHHKIDRLSIFVGWCLCQQKVR